MQPAVCVTLAYRPDCGRRLVMNIVFGYIIDKTNEIYQVNVGC